MNLTLVAFYGPKPDPLIRLVDIMQNALHSELGPLFFPYTAEQVHATIIGLEGRRDRTMLINTNASQVFGKSLAMDLHGLLQFMQKLSPFHIRIGGFVASNSYPFTSRGQHPYARSFVLNRSTAVMLGWPVADESYPRMLDSLRRECGQYNVLHKYFQKQNDLDNDLFFVLGRVDRESISQENAEYIQGTLRQLLAEREPLDILLRREDLSVVAYTDNTLPTANSRRYSLVESLARLEELKLLYEEGT